MREILFRGQTRRYGEKVRMNGEKVKSNWVYGGIFPNNRGGDFSIIYQQEPTIEKFTVYSDTVGQYTGLTDKNGTKIFEGDILEFTDGDDEKIPYLVVWDDFFSSWHIAQNGDRNFWDDFADFESERFEVIGNIHDNPELLEVSE